MVARFFITLVVVWQAWVAPVAMGAMAHEPLADSSAAHTELGSADNDHVANSAHHDAAKPCCDVAGHCTPPGLPSAAVPVMPTPAADPGYKHPIVARPSGFPTVPYRPPSARLS